VQQSKKISELQLKLIHSDELNNNLTIQMNALNQAKLSEKEYYEDQLADLVKSKTLDLQALSNLHEEKYQALQSKSQAEMTKLQDSLLLITENYFALVQQFNISKVTLIQQLENATELNNDILVQLFDSTQNKIFIIDPLGGTH
jgi:hypothetical protein